MSALMYSGDDYALAFSVRAHRHKGLLASLKALAESAFRCVRDDLPDVPPDLILEPYQDPTFNLSTTYGSVPPCMEEPPVRFWAMRWDESLDSDNRLRWVCDLRLAADIEQPDDLRVLIRAHIGSDRTSSVGVEVDARLPSIAGDLITTYNAHIEGRAITGRVARVAKRQAERFMREDLMATDRNLPILAVAECEDGAGLPLDRDALADAGFAGLAEVYLIERGAAAAINSRVAEGLACEPGAVRLWWPGLREDDHERALSFWPASLVAESPPLVLSMLRNAVMRAAARRSTPEIRLWEHLEASQLEDERYHADEQLLDVAADLLPRALEAHGLGRQTAPEPSPAAAELQRLQCDLDEVSGNLAQATRREQRLARNLEEARAQLGSVNSEQDSRRHRAVEGVQRKLDEELERSRTLDCEVGDLRQALDRERADAALVHLADEQFAEARQLQAEAARLRYENGILSVRLAERAAADGDIALDTDPEPLTVLDAVLDAEQRFMRLRFTPESKRSAGQSTFARPQDVYRAFGLLNDLAQELALSGGSVGVQLRDRFRDAGFDYVPSESLETMARWAAERRASYAERTYEMTRHLRWGGRSRDSRNHLRLYFAWEEDGYYMVIGHAGAHLTNTHT